MIRYQYRQFLDFSKEIYNLNILHFLPHFRINGFIFSNSQRILGEGDNRILYLVLDE